MSACLPAAPGTSELSPERVGLRRKVPAFISHHAPIRPFFPKTLRTPRGQGGPGLASPFPHHGSALRAVTWPESPRLCVSLFMCLSSVPPPLQGLCWSHVVLSPTSPPPPWPAPQGAAPPCHPGPCVPVSWKRPSVPVGQNAQAPHCRQHKAETLGTRPLTHLCSLGSCPTAGIAALAGLCVCVFLRVGN